MDESGTTIILYGLCSTPLNPREGQKHFLLSQRIRPAMRFTLVNACTISDSTSILLQYDIVIEDFVTLLPFMFQKKAENCKTLKFP